MRANILKLYTSNEEDFYTILNQWLFSFNYLIYKEIGPIVGKLINLLENKKNNYLKGITKETFYKVNIHYNWQKIIEFLINKNYPMT